jgi:hypothetical protein
MYIWGKLSKMVSARMLIHKIYSWSWAFRDVRSRWQLADLLLQQLNPLLEFFGPFQLPGETGQELSHFLPQKWPMRRQCLRLEPILRSLFTTPALKNLPLPMYNKYPIYIWSASLKQKCFILLWKTLYTVLQIKWSWDWLLDPILRSRVATLALWKLKQNNCPSVISNQSIFYFGKHIILGTYCNARVEIVNAYRIGPWAATAWRNCSFNSLDFSNCCFRSAASELAPGLWSHLIRDQYYDFLALSCHSGHNIPKRGKNIPK